MKRILLVAFFLGLLYVPISCSNDKCSTSFNSITELDVEFGALQPTFYNFFPRESTSFDSASFRISIAEVQLDSIAVLRTGLFPAAYAESPPICPSELSNKLQSVNITSTDDISVGPNLYPSGESLNSLFDVIYEYDYARQSEFEKLPQDLNEQPQKFSKPYDSIYLLMVAKPNQVVEGAFTFTFIFDNGSMSVSSEVVTILP